MLTATLSLVVACFAAPARAQAPAPGAAQDQGAPPPNPYAQPGGSPPPSQYPPANPPPSNFGYGQPAYPVQQTPYPPPGYGYPPPAVSAAPQPAQEQFGRRGQVVITQGFGFITRDENSSQVRLNPALSFFVANNLSVGVDATFDYYTFDGSSDSIKQGGIGLSLGGNIPMGSAVSLWPTLNNSYWVPDRGSNQGATSITVPLLIHVAQHFFIAAGPELSMYRNFSGAETDLHFRRSLVTFIGGWW